MKRALAGAFLLILAAVVSFTPIASPLGTDTRAVAADCAWQRHSKRVVEHVKRHGQSRRIVRWRHWWSCEPVSPPAIGIPPVTAPAPSSPSAPEPEPDPGIARLSVKAVEYSYTLSRPSVAPGELIVELNNQGGDPHNLNLQREGSADPALEVAETGPAEHRTARFALSPGTYRLWCSLPTHEEEGMVSTLLVAD